MRAPTEILGVRYFLLGVIFTRTNTRVESSHQGTPQNKNKSFSLSFLDCQSLWAGSAYITLGVASAFGPDHYILPHITQRIQAASAFQARPHFISYPGAVTTLSHLQRKCGIGGPRSTTSVSTPTPQPPNSPNPHRGQYFYTHSGLPYPLPQPIPIPSTRGKQPDIGRTPN